MYRASHGYPRPQLERADWLSLNGPWQFALDPDATWKSPDQVSMRSTILVPFAPETPASGIHYTHFFRACWYRRTFDAPPLENGQRLILHFGAVDYAATVWVNGFEVARHEGGYSPFSADITDLLVKDGPQVVTVRAEDDPGDLSKPRGKQDWQLEAHSIWYPRTTGIWQTAWLERVPATRINALRFTPSIERWEIGLDVALEGERPDGLRLNVKFHIGNMLLADDTYVTVGSEISRRIALSDPGIDDFRNELLWSPATPRLIRVSLELSDKQGRIIDSVNSYTALRSIGVQGDRFVLNGRPYQLRMVLDQGYWPESGLTAPDDEAFRRDIDLVRAMGFNGVRKHQKIEDPRFLYWADTMGLLVWEEMPSAYRFTPTSVDRLTQEWGAVIDRDISHPSVVAWVPFNESWGVPDLPDSPSQRHYVQALYHLTKTLDPTRPVIGNDGWESVATDIVGIHDYDEDPDCLARRYGRDETAQLFKRERPGGRLLILDRQGHTGQPVMLTEFGGIALSSDPEGTWGYSRCLTADEFADRYRDLLAVVRNVPLFAGFCYTQFTDTYQEANGLLYADRTPKFPIELIEAATRGGRSARDRQTEAGWRERIMKYQRQQYLVPAEDYQMQEPR